jgi:PBP1b-binding outer membrane lipoprotein LpoB
MKRIAVACISLLLLAGCSSAPAPTTSDSATKDQTFLAIRDDMKMAPTTSGDAALISDAHAICTGFNDGLTAVQINVVILKSLGNIFTLDQTSELVAMSVLVYCPEHKGALPSP